MSNNIFEVEQSKTGLVNVPKPKTVYKYRSWNAGDIYHDNVLLKNQLYMSAPSDFLDKMDCKNPTRYDLLTKEELRIWIGGLMKEQHPKYNDKAIQNLVMELEGLNKFQDKEWMAKSQEQDWQQFNQLAGVLSLTRNPLNERMWVEYGNYHKGIAYGFDTDALIIGCGVGGGGDVSYNDELPIILPLMDYTLQFTLRSFYKTKEWEFEDEYRLRSFGTDSRTKVFPDGSLTTVVLGKDFDGQQVPFIVDKLRAKPNRVTLYQCNYNNEALVLREIEY
jgi:hypothetical protein